MGEALTVPATSDLQMSLASFIAHLLPLLPVAPCLTCFLHTVLVLSESAKLRERENRPLDLPLEKSVCKSGSNS